MRVYRRFAGVGQMAAAVCAFAVVALVLESGGLVDWAERLELGPERTVVLPAVITVHRGLERLGVERLREAALVELARVGWSDDPAALAKARGGAKVVARVVVQPAPMVVPTAVPAVAAPIVKAGGVSALPAKAVGGTLPTVNLLPELGPVEAGETRTVVLAGDSMMAVGLSSTMLREAGRYKDLVMVKAFKSGTGLARPEVFDWAAEYPAMLAGAKPDVVVVAIGANDGQGFIDGGVTYPFGTDRWKAIYQARVEAYLRMLEADGATVVWVALPPMKNDAYDARAAVVNQIDSAVVKASPHAVWFSTSALFGDAKGKFQDYGQVHGATVRLRQEDGIHLSDAGAELVVEKLLPWLEGKRLEK